MGMEVHQIPEGLNGHNHPRQTALLPQGGVKKDLQTLIGALAEFPQ
jgi:hypothetical protein